MIQSNIVKLYTVFQYLARNIGKFFRKIKTFTGTGFKTVNMTKGGGFSLWTKFPEISGRPQGIAMFNFSSQSITPLHCGFGGTEI